jgi:hypothetical protein
MNARPLMRSLWVAPLLIGAQLFAQEVIQPTSYGITNPADAARAAAEPTVPDIPRLFHEHHRELPSLPSAAPGTRDPVLQTSPLPSVQAALGLNFLGQGNTFPGFTITGEPPDTNGAVGTTQYVQIVNAMYTVFNKTTGTVAQAPRNINTLFAGLAANSICRTTNRGDPIALFDRIAGRWFLSQFAFSALFNGTYSQCIAVSTTSDATGPYAVYEYSFPDFPDYPKFGVWPDAYYGTYNMFSHTSPGPFLNAKACAYDRAAMLIGAVANSVCFNTPAGQDFSLMPSDMDGNTLPPAGAPNPLWELWDIGILRRFKFHVDFVTPANSTFIGPTTMPVASFTFVCNNFAGNTDTCVTQPSTSQLLDTLGDRMMFRAPYRNFGGREVVMLTHSVDSTGPPNDFSGVRWYEIRDPNGAATVFQQATFAPATNEHRWMPSVAQDKLGNALLGYSASGGATFPSIRFTGRTRGEPRGFMESEGSIQIGTGSQIGHSRWGDYSAMTIDPVDDCTFWFTTEYIDAPSGDFIWKTRIANFKFPNCQ